VRWWLVLVCVWLLAGLGLRGGDPVAAQALWTYAVSVAPDDLTESVYADAARELARIRPWQEGFSTARERLAGIEEARMALANARSRRR